MMKSSLRKLRGFAFQKNTDHKEKRNQGASNGLNDLLHASQDMLDMRNCYDSLLSAAAATANSAYEFSEALREMGTCLLDKTSLNDDEESGRVLLMIARVQFELQKLVDIYRAHIIQTITIPSECLLKELHTVEEMKRQCDDKRDLYKFMLAAHRETGRIRNAKGESFSSQQLQAAREDYEEEANLVVFRLKSFKQGQSRSLLTQAARHHAAQLNFFKKGVKSLEVIEPHVKVVAEQQHIDYNFVGLEDDDLDDKDYGFDSNDYGELSFDYNLHESHQDIGSKRNSMEVDQENLTVTTSTTSVVQEVLAKGQGDLLSFHGGLRTGSQSAPILTDKKFEPSERVKQMDDLTPRKCHSYVLPMPDDAKMLPVPCSQNSPVGRPHNEDGWPKQLWHSSPLETDKPVEDLKDELSGSISSNILCSVPNQSNISKCPIKLPSPLAEGLSLPLSSLQSETSDAKKINRPAFSGPLIANSSLNNSRLSSNEFIQSVQCPELSLVSGFIQSPQMSLSPSLSPSSSSLPMLSSKTNELYKLPRPPVTSAKPWRLSNLSGYSGPLVQRSGGPYTTHQMLSNTASQLPTPPSVMARSFSIPYSGQRSVVKEVGNFLETGDNAKQDEISSLTVKLITLSNNQPSRKSSESVALSTKPKGLQ